MNANNLFDFVLEASKQEENKRSGRLSAKRPLDEDFFELDLHFRRPPIESYLQVTVGPKIDLDALPLYSK